MEFRDDQRMTGCDRIYVHEGEGFSIFEDFETRDLNPDDLTEDAVVV